MCLSCFGEDDWPYHPGMASPLPKAIVLLSGGLDSATTLAIAQDEGFAPHPLAFDYGQRHRHELEAARQVAASLGAREPLVVAFDLRAIGGSALTDDIAVPKRDDAAAIPTEIPLTYVPARNTVFLSFALGYAEVIGASHVFIGVNAVDYSGYPDCRPAFIEAFERMAALATKAGVEGQPLEIHTPLMNLSKADIIRRGLALGVDYGLTWSCYDPTPKMEPCGSCDSCILRAAGFRKAGAEDPLVQSA